jgi:hypothetical protein
LASGIDKGDVLESPLNLRQLAALSLGRTRKVFREREVLHRQSDKGHGSGSVGPFSKLLQHVEVPIRGGVGVRLEVLAKLVNEQQYGSELGQAFQGLAHRLRSRTGGIVITEPTDRIRQELHNAPSQSLTPG